MNMENLKGKTILIGRSVTDSRLAVSLPDGKTILFGTPGSVPASVSRCIPKEGKAHARMTVDAAGAVTVHNAKQQNCTFVNEVLIDSKRVNMTDTVALGPDKYAVPVKTLIDLAAKLAASIPSGGNQSGGQGLSCGASGNLGGSQGTREKYNINHLHRIWEDAAIRRKAIRDRQRNIGLVRGLSGILTPASIVLALVWEPARAIMILISVAIGGVGIYSMMKTNAPEEQEKINEELQNTYVCPKCGKYLGNYSYRFLKKNWGMQCPYCKCAYEEKPAIPPQFHHD